MRILLTALGVRSADTTYQWRQRTVQAPLAPLALLQLMDEHDRPVRVIALRTTEAESKTWSVFNAQVQQLTGLAPEPIPIPDGENADELRTIVERVAACIPEGSRLTLDVTQGLRHFPFVMYAVAMYLQSLRGVQIGAVYYGMLESKQTVKPIVDLRELLELPEWFHAVRVFRDQGLALPMARLVRPLSEQLRRRAQQRDNDRDLHQQASLAQRVAERLEQHSFASAAALPLEAGKASRCLIEPIRQLARSQLASSLPLATELAEVIADAAGAIALPVEPPAKGKWKTTITLDERELARHARMIDEYLDRGQIPLAVGLMREWVISWAMSASGRTADWLPYVERKPFERRLGALAAMVKDPRLTSVVTPQQQEFAEFWNCLADELRNALHHHAMREDSLEEPPKALRKVQEFWGRLKHGQVELPMLGGGCGRTLITPQGKRPGVLFSALRLTTPDRCLVVCSRESAGSLFDVARRAGFTGALEPIELADPFGDFGEIEAIITLTRPRLLEADQVLANLTGGTTLMGIVVQQLIEAARKLDRPTRRFALIDRRPPAQQDSDPYVASESHWLDPVEGESDGNQ